MPPVVGTNRVAVWSNGSWTLEPDYRQAALYATATGLPVRATAIGQTLDQLAATLSAPPDATGTWTFNGMSWSVNQVALVAYLEQYATNVYTNLTKNDIQVNVGTPGLPVIAKVSIDSTGMTDILALQAKVAEGATTIVWRQTGGALTLTPAQLALIANSAGEVIENAWNTWQAAVDGVAATPPTITTTAQIDLLSWPSVTIVYGGN